MVVMVFGENDTTRIVPLMNHIQDRFSFITSLNYVINPKLNDTIHDLEIITYHGKDHILEVMDGLKFRIGPKSFFQTNSLQALLLYRTVLDFAELSGPETVYDLYTGTGTIAAFLARKAGKVIGIEYVEEAVADARTNIALNGLTNASFRAGDLREVLSEQFMAEYGRPDVIVTDPPRTGMHAEVVKNLLRAAPEKIVYVSCNPATQARDIHLLSAAYRITAIQPVDMFPHTHHVENVVRLDRR
jgi:23S rRNA (uracil1939-C5)-methyltransferase